MTVSDNKDKCVTCKYYRNEGAHLGVCKRFPSVMNKHQNDWCGEFSEKQPVENFAELQELSEQPKKRGRKPNAKTAA